MSYVSIAGLHAAPTLVWCSVTSVSSARVASILVFSVSLLILSVICTVYIVFCPSMTETRFVVLILVCFTVDVLLAYFIELMWIWL